MKKRNSLSATKALEGGLELREVHSGKGSLGAVWQQSLAWKDGAVEAISHP